jgi:hypothetical protein
MTVIGFNFKKITAEKTELVVPKVQVANNVVIKKVQEVAIPMGKEKQSALSFIYEFTTKYEPNVGSVIIEGEVIYLASKELFDKTMKEWQKGKKIDKDLLTPILNTILAKCTIQCLIMSQDLNLPAPMQLPRVTVK